MADSLDGQSCPTSPSQDLADESTRLSEEFESEPLSPCFRERDQTVIFFDWDETLFPTSELLGRWKLNWRTPGEHLSPKQHILLSEWSAAASAYLTAACSLSAQVTIITNSSPPWVETCVSRFGGKDLKEVFASHSGLKVVYAPSLFAGKERDGAKLAPSRLKVAECHHEKQSQFTYAKYYAMKKETEAFYSKYPWQTWKNILSLGDMEYEHDAVQEVAFKRVAKQMHERIRTKAIVLPTEPSISEITSRLRFSLHMLPAYVSFDGDIDLDLRHASDPLAAIAEALGMAALCDLHFSRHAWGREYTPAAEDESKMLTSLAMVIKSEVNF